MRASELIGLVLQTTSGENRQRRENAVRAFLRGQHQKDSEVRFQQVDLVNNVLLDLFVDVPLALSQSDDDRLHTYLRKRWDATNTSGTPVAVGAARAILDPDLVDMVWWREQLESTVTRLDKMFAICLFTLFAHPTTLTNLQTKASTLVDELDEDDFRRVLLCNSTGVFEYRYQRRHRLNPKASDWPKDRHLQGSFQPSQPVSPRFIVALARGSCNDSDAAWLGRDVLAGYTGSELAVLEECQRSAFANLRSGGPDLGESVELLRSTYAQGAVTRARPPSGADLHAYNLPEGLARQILAEPYAYPRAAAAIAEQAVRASIQATAEQVGLVAERQQWFPAMVPCPERA